MSCRTNHAMLMAAVVMRPVAIGFVLTTETARSNAPLAMFARVWLLLVECHEFAGSVLTPKDQNELSSMTLWSSISVRRESWRRDEMVCCEYLAGLTQPSPDVRCVMALHNKLSPNITNNSRSICENALSVCHGVDISGSSFKTGPAYLGHYRCIYLPL